MKQLYKVHFINQMTGEETFTYVVANNVQDIINEYADVFKIEFLMPFNDLTNETI